LKGRSGDDIFFIENPLGDLVAVGIPLLKHIPEGFSIPHIYFRVSIILIDHQRGIAFVLRRLASGIEYRGSLW